MSNSKNTEQPPTISELVSNYKVAFNTFSELSKPETTVAPDQIDTEIEKAAKNIIIAHSDLGVQLQQPNQGNITAAQELYDDNREFVEQAKGFFTRKELADIDMPTLPTSTISNFQPRGSNLQPRVKLAAEVAHSR